MFFIALLVATTMAVAGAAAYFSVYGLAYTFSGVFWSVVAMGVSLEAAKLMAASYLYRYWTQTSLVLKSYLIGGVAALMMLTSVGIFGYLSVGYQQDILPLKQKQEQISLLEGERGRILERKKQIDELMAQGPAVTNVTRANGNIDPNAARTIAAAQRARTAMVQQYRAEQTEVNARVKELDTELLALKQDTLQAEAKVGPIAFIAQAFGLPTDNATMYLIFIIIFAFDPMAVALTIAVNTALRIRRDEKLAAIPVPVPVEPDLVVEPEPEPEVVHEEADEPEPELLAKVYPVEPEIEPEIDWELEPIDEVAVESEVVEPEPVAEVELTLTPTEPDVPEEVVMPEPDDEPEQETEAARQQKRLRPYPARWNVDDTHQDNIRELIGHHKYLSAKHDNGNALTDREIWEMQNIERLLAKHGVDLYLKS